MPTPLVTVGTTKSLNFDRYTALVPGIIAANYFQFDYFQNDYFQAGTFSVSGNTESNTIGLDFSRETATVRLDS